MNYAEAKEIIFSETECECCEYSKAKGYLEAFALAEKLAEALKKISERDYRGNRSQDSVDAYHALVDFEKAKGEK